MFKVDWLRSQCSDVEGRVVDFLDISVIKGEVRLNYGDRNLYVTEIYLNSLAAIELDAWLGINEVFIEVNEIKRNGEVSFLTLGARAVGIVFTTNHLNGLKVSKFGQNSYFYLQHSAHVDEYALNVGEFIDVSSHSDKNSSYFSSFHDKYMRRLELINT